MENYTNVLSDSATYSALWVTVKLTVGAVLLSVLVGLACALLVDRKFLGRGLARTLAHHPVPVMPAAAALVWKWLMLDSNVGMVNWSLGPFGIDPVQWTSHYPLLATIVVETWQYTPFMMLILIGGLRARAGTSWRRRPWTARGPSGSSGP